MREPLRRRLALAAVLAVAATVFVAGIDWGLPSKAADPFLFGDRPAWTGQAILDLAGGWGERSTAGLGADVDLNPLQRRDEPLVLNATDAQRAEIVRRYRLFSYQPDEMITFRALSQMSPGRLQLDPKLYQYGGLWMYPVGGMLKAASVVGLVELRSGPDALAYYLDHPDAFGRFYVVARLYTALWGVVGAWAVFWIIGRLTNGSVAYAAAGGLCYALMPVVVAMAHEAKPHLPGAVLMLGAVIAAAKYVETGRSRWWVIAGAACGAAFGMVLSSLPVFAVLPVMAWLRPAPWRRAALVLIGAGAAGILTYLVTNPYVAINGLREYVVDPHVGPLRSNLSNSTAMYRVGDWPAGLANAAMLSLEGTSTGLFLAGVVGVIVGGVAAARRPPARGNGGAASHPLIWLLAAPAGLIAIQFVALAAGKPGEYGRFAILPDIALAVAALAVLHRATAAGRQTFALVLLGVFALATAVEGWTYLRGFLRDRGDHTSRLAAAVALREQVARGAEVIVPPNEPAPYVMPPVDLFRTRLVLGAPDQADVQVVVYEGPAPISWADKRIIALPRRSLGMPTTEPR